jgi:hypothetical protein
MNEQAMSLKLKRMPSVQSEGASIEAMSGSGNDDDYSEDALLDLFAVAEGFKSD